MTTAVVLSGGGAKGGFEVGALRRIVQDRSPAAYYGTSVGALNAVTMALHGINRLEEEWRSIRGQEDVIEAKFPLALPWSTGLYTMKPLRDRILRTIHSGSGVPLARGVVCYCDMETGAVLYDEVRNWQTIARSAEASACIPVAMELVEGRFADGGLREQTPLRIAIDEGADEIIVVLCNPVRNLLDAGWKPKFPHLLSTAMRAADIMAHEIFLNDLKVCRKKNTLEGYKQITLKVIAPEIQLADTLDFSPARIASDMQYGYQRAEECLG